jgi:hypothetical protein
MHTKFVEEKRPLGRSSCRWEDNIERVWGALDCIRLDQWRAVVNTVMNLVIA